jgi:hypothetical protein
VPLCFCAGIERMVHDHARSILRYYVCPAHVLGGTGCQCGNGGWPAQLAPGWCSARRPLLLVARSYCRESRGA